MNVVLHVDMDSFFASIEVRENPDLRGLPVVVGADPKMGKGRGVVTTCTYEARRFGLHSGMPISKAYRLAPDAVYLRGNYKLYITVSKNVMKILRGFGDCFRQVSIDEAYLDVSEKVASYHQARSLARRVKDAVLEEEGLSCSVGVGPNMLVAKIASDFGKPDGLTVVEPDSVEGFLGPLSVRAIPGIGPKAEKSLKKLGFSTVGDIAGSDPDVLGRFFGRWGLAMLRSARGIDAREVGWERGGRKSIGKERTFHVDTLDRDEIRGTLGGLVEKVASIAEDNMIHYRTVSVKVRLEDFSTFSRSRTLDFPTTSLAALRSTAARLVDEFLAGDKKIRLVGVRVSGLARSVMRQTTLEEYVGCSAI